jgi:hypothetical protein
VDAVIHRDDAEIPGQIVDEPRRPLSVHAARKAMREDNGFALPHILEKSGRCPTGNTGGFPYFTAFG